MYIGVCIYVCMYVVYECMNVCMQCIYVLILSYNMYALYVCMYVCVCVLATEVRQGFQDELLDLVQGAADVAEEDLADVHFATAK
jgi:hypothetical protein